MRGESYAAEYLPLGRRGSGGGLFQYLSSKCVTLIFYTWYQVEQVRVAAVFVSYIENIAPVCLFSRVFIN